MSPQVSEMVYHPDIALMRLLIASGDVIGIAAGGQYLDYSGPGQVGIQEIVERLLPAVLMEEVFYPHVRIVLKTGIIVQVEEIIVTRIRQDTERDRCQAYL